MKKDLTAGNERRIIRAYRFSNRYAGRKPAFSVSIIGAESSVVARPWTTCFGVVRTLCAFFIWGKTGMRI